MTQGSIFGSRRHWKLREKAQALRSKGLSYREIRQQIPVSKSTISLWCRNVPLSKMQWQTLKSRRGTLNGVKAIHKRYWEKRCQAFEKGVAKTKKYGDDHVFVAGLMLYWAEGMKTQGAAIANSDPYIIRLMAKWFRRYFEVGPTSASIHLHLHSGQNELAMKKYWSEITGVPLVNFQKPFVKPEGSGYRKNILYHGTVQYRVKGDGSTYVLFEILGAIAGYLHQTVGVRIDPEQWMSRSPYAF